MVVAKTDDKGSRLASSGKRRARESCPTEVVEGDIGLTRRKGGAGAKSKKVKTPREEDETLNRGVSVDGKQQPHGRPRKRRRAGISGVVMDSGGCEGKRKGDRDKSQGEGTAGGRDMARAQGSKGNKLSELQQRMRRKLEGGQFRMINERLYTSPSSESLEKFQQEPHLFDVVSELGRFQSLVLFLLCAPNSQKYLPR
ncbi:unnamed protein product [Discosporangium mesarthrocarpum]